MLTPKLPVDLSASIDQLKSPAHKINILMPVLACLFLAAWVITLVAGSTTDLKQINKDLRTEVKRLESVLQKTTIDMQAKIDEVNNKRFQESQEQVQRLQTIYSGQSHVKKAIDKKIIIP